MTADGLRHYAGTVKTWYRQPWLQWLTAAVIFFLISWVYMGSAITQCGTATPAFNSDTTGGTVWFQWASGNGLRWHATELSNYPVGEPLNRPQFITSEAFDIPYRIFSSLTTPICGINLMILLAYMSAGLLMYGLVRWLLRKQAIAYFAGFAAAFVPYHQMKSASHVPYMFSSVFIAMIWAFLWFVQRPSYKRLGLFAVLTALASYVDGYFVLIGALLAGGLFAGVLLRGAARLTYKKGVAGLQVSFVRFWANVKQYILYLVAFGVFFAILATPILIVQKNHRQDIQHSLSAARGNIQLEAVEYGARPVEFFLPSITNPLLPQSYVNWRGSATEQHSSNPSENTIYLGLTIIGLAFVALAYCFNRRVRNLDLNGLSYGAVMSVIGVALFVAVIFSFEAHFTLHGHILPAPFDLILKVTHNWRVPTRLFAAIDPLAVIVAAMGFYALTKKMRTGWYIAAVVIVAGLLVVEYFPSWPVHNGDLKKDTPMVYHRIAHDPTVSAVAEYPNLALKYVPATFTFQQFYGKPVFNANDSETSLGAFGQSISGLNDTQTVGVLKARGINVVTAYGLDVGSNPGLTPYQAPDKSSHKVYLPTIYSYRIVPSAPARPYALVAGAGFDFATTDDHQISHHVLSVPGSLQVDDRNGSLAPAGNYDVSFDISPFIASRARVTVKQGANILWSGVVTRSDVSNVSFEVSKPGGITVTTDNPIDITNLSAVR